MKKKITAVFIVLLICIMSVGCGENTEITPADGTEIIEEDQSAEEPKEKETESLESESTDTQSSEDGNTESAESNTPKEIRKVLQSITVSTSTGDNVTEYEYDNAGRVILERRNFGSFLVIEYRFKYDENGNLIEELPYWEVLTNDAITTNTNGGERLDGINGYISEYDTEGRLIKQTSYRWNNSLKENILTGPTITYVYDSDGLLVKEIRESESGTTECSYSYTFDAEGRMTSKREDYGTEVNNRTYEYDATGNLIKETDPFWSDVYTYTYNELGQLIKKVEESEVMETQCYQYTYDSSGLLVEELKYFPNFPDSKTLITYTYDADGDVIYKENSGREKTTYVYTTIAVE